MKTLYRRLLLTGLCIALSFPAAYAQFKKLDGYLDSLNSGFDAMGSMTIIRNSSVVYQKITGYRDPQTAYRIGSISKIYTAVMIFQLIEEKKLTLQTPLARYFPNVPNAKTITIADLLDHRSGLSDIKEIHDFANWSQKPRTRADILSQIEQSTIHFAPGSKSEYNNSGFILLSYIIEDITKQTYAEVLPGRICVKAGLRNTYYGPAKSRSYVFDKGWQPATVTDPSVPAGAGGIVATNSDLARFIVALFNGKLISKNSLDQMLKVKDDYGYGILAYPDAYGHDGEIDGYFSAVRYFPKNKITIAYCTNALYYPIADIIKAATAVTQNKPYQVQVPDNYYGQDLTKVYRELKNEDSLFYNAIFHTKDLKYATSKLAPGFVFYQDQGYTAATNGQSRAKYVEGLASLCDPKAQNPDMRRDVVKGSLQLFITGPHEVVQTGTQHFYVMTEGAPEQLVEESKFSRTWIQQNGHWQIARELDYLYNTHLNDPAPQPTAAAVKDRLSKEILAQDSLLFGAFNNQDIETTKKLYAPDTKFLDDISGVTSYAQTINNFQRIFERNKRNGLKRKLIPGSVEIYPIKDYGAIEIGRHRFCHTENGQPDCGEFKFVIVWKKTAAGWQAARLISYGHVDSLKPDDKQYQTIANLDKTLFDSFNDQQADLMAKLFSKDLEFYQDNEGLENYDQTMKDFTGMFASFRGQNLRRDLVPNKLQIYPVKDYGALEIGEHKFTHTENGKELSGTFKFFNLWEQKDGKWTLAMTISYGH